MQCGLHTHTHTHQIAIKERKTEKKRQAFTQILRCCGLYSYNSYHIFSHIAITEDQEDDNDDVDDDDDEDQDFMAYVHLSPILDE